MSEIILKGSFAEHENGESKIDVRDGNGRYLFSVLKNAEGRLFIKDEELNDLRFGDGNMPTEKPQDGTAWGLTYDPETSEYVWREVNVPVE